MPTTAKSSMGAALKITIVATPTLVGQIVTLNGADITTEFDDITNLDSTGGFREWEPILRDGGTVSGELVWNGANASQVEMKSANTLGSLEVFSITWPFATPVIDSFSGYVSKWQQKAETGKVMRASFEIKVTGTIVTT